MALGQKISLLTFQVDPTAGSVLNIHVEGVIPRLYTDSSAAPDETFGRDFTKDDLVAAFATLYPGIDPMAALAKLRQAVLQMVITKMQQERQGG